MLFAAALALAHATGLSQVDDAAQRPGTFDPGFQQNTSQTP